jgi:SNF2 family DNA or RNA helicase
MTDARFTPTFSVGAPLLVICPATLRKNWMDEFDKWGVTFRVAVCHGKRVDSAVAAIRAGQKEIVIIGKERFT